MAAMTNVQKMTVALAIVTGVAAVFVAFQNGVTALGRERALAAQGMLLGLSLACFFVVVLVRRAAFAESLDAASAGASASAESRERR